MKVLTDGKSDGIMLAYVKNGTVYPLGLSQEQSEMVDLMLGMALNDTKVTYLEKHPMGKVYNMKE